MTEHTLIYQTELDNWISFLHEDKHYFLQYPEEQQLQTLCKKYYSEVFIPNIHQKFGMKLLLDNDLSKLLCQKFEQLHYQRFSYKPKPTSLTYFQQQPWIYLLHISKTLYNNKFISKCYYNQIVNSCSDTNSIQKKLMDFYSAREKQKKQKQNDKQIVDIQTWSNITNFDFQQFWTKYIFLKPTLISQSLTMKRIFKIFNHTLQNKLKQKDYNQILSLLNINCFVLENIANSLWLFNNPNKIKQIQQQLTIFINTLSDQIQKQSLYDNIYFQTFGSYRSKICLHNSDIDLTIFLQNQQLQYKTKPFIKKCISNIEGILRKLFKINNTQLKMQSIVAINTQTIKVPFIRIKFSNQMPLNSLDIVINNYHGVTNSKMLQIYAQNPIIRNTGILIKKWAKINDLVSPMKMSSYGLMLMLLFFLMTTGQLQFFTQQNIKNSNFNNKLKGTQDTFEIFTNFLTFYQTDTQFNKKTDTACLIIGCNNHHYLFNQQFVINIHDPFDHTNPGRIKSRDRCLFINSFMKTIKKIKQIQQGSKKCKEQCFREVFGMNEKKGRTRRSDFVDTWF